MKIGCEGSRREGHNDWATYEWEQHYATNMCCAQPGQQFLAIRRREYGGQRIVVALARTAFGQHDKMQIVIA